VAVHRALFLSGLLCAVFATRIAVGFHSFRAKLIDQAPATAVADIVRVDIGPDRTSGDLVPPFAVVARILNGSDSTQAFTIRIDDRSVCTQKVTTGAARRIDCAWTGDWNPRATHTIEVAGGAFPFTVTYLELATHHGATRGYDLIVVPAGALHYAQPTLAWIVLAFVVIVLVFLLPEPRMSRAVVRLHRSISAIVALLLFLIFVSPYVSTYRVLLSTAAFAEAICLLAAPRLWQAGQWAWDRQHEAVWGPLAWCLVSATFVLTVYGAVVASRLEDDYHGNYSGFLHVSRTFFDQDPMLSGRLDVRRSLVLNESRGYDGQFMYFETFDPFLRQYKDHPAIYRQFIDAPPYRFGRIGFSLLTKLFSGDRWQFYPATMTWLILSSLFLCGLSLAFIARFAGANAAWGMVAVLVPGFWQSAQVALPEPVAAAFLLSGYVYLLRGRPRYAGLLFAVSLLVRETGAVLVLSLVATMLVSGRRRDAVLLAAISLTPLLVWRLYVGWILFPDWGAQAFWFNPENLGKPFAGIIGLWSTIRHGQYFPGLPNMSRAGLWYSVLLLAALSTALAVAIRIRTAVAFAAVLYGVMAISLTYSSIWVHVGNAQRGTYELFVAVAMLSVHIKTYPRVLQRGLFAFWAASAAYMLFGALDAEFIRSAVIG
jgi:hypothetical protein